MSDPIYISTVGYMVGDCWLNVPRVIYQCQRQSGQSVRLVCGSYALPVWEAAADLIAGADYEIAEVVDDPDDGEHPWSPGFGAKAYIPAHEELSKRYPGLLLLDQCAPGVTDLPFPVKLRRPQAESDHVVVHPYTRHAWKNLQGLMYEVKFRRPVVQVGWPDEPRLAGALHLHDAPYAEQVLATAIAHAVVGVASSFICIACIFHKRAMIANFSFDNSFWPPNPNAIKLRQPTLCELQAAVDREGL